MQCLFRPVGRSIQDEDYGNDSYSGDCFSFVGQIQGIDCRHAAGFLDILQKINQDLCLGLENNSFPSLISLSSRREYPQGERGLERVAEGRERSSSTKSITMENQTEQPKTPKAFSFKIKPFSEGELEYWQQFGITSATLIKYQVVSLKEFAYRKQ